MGNDRKAGRKRLKEHELRESCHDIRLTAYWRHWLKSHPRVGGRMIEEALDSYFAPDTKKMIEEFYQARTEGAQNGGHEQHAIEHD